MRNRVVALVALLASLSAVACGGYRVVSQSPTGGTVALEGQRDSAREKAEEFMGSKCPFGYDVLPDMSPSVDRELRITFRCKSPEGQAQHASARESRVVVAF